MEVPIEGDNPAKRELVILKKSDQNTLQVSAQHPLTLMVIL